MSYFCSPRHRETGFGLIEVLMAIALMAGLPLIVIITVKTKITAAKKASQIGEFDDLRHYVRERFDCEVSLANVNATTDCVAEHLIRAVDYDGSTMIDTGATTFGKYQVRLRCSESAQAGELIFEAKKEGETKWAKIFADALYIVDKYAIHPLVYEDLAVEPLAMLLFDSSGDATACQKVPASCPSDPNSCISKKICFDTVAPCSSWVHEGPPKTGCPYAYDGKVQQNPVVSNIPQHDLYVSIPHLTGRYAYNSSSSLACTAVSPNLQFTDKNGHRLDQLDAPNPSHLFHGSVPLGDIMHARRMKIPSGADKMFVGIRDTTYFDNSGNCRYTVKFSRPCH